MCARLDGGGVGAEEKEKMNNTFKVCINTDRCEIKKERKLDLINEYLN